jgi:hypothetical protein
VDAVQLAGVLVPELAGNDFADVAASGGVVLVGQGLEHESVPEVGYLPEVDIWEASQRAGKPEAREGRNDYVTGVGGVAAERSRVGELVYHLRPVPERPRPPVRQD